MDPAGYPNPPTVAWRSWQAVGSTWNSWCRSLTVAPEVTGSRRPRLITLRPNTAPKKEIIQIWAMFFKQHYYQDTAVQTANKSRAVLHTTFLNIHFCLAHDIRCGRGGGCVTLYVRYVMPRLRRGATKRRRQHPSHLDTHQISTSFVVHPPLVVCRGGGHRRATGSDFYSSVPLLLRY